MRSPLASPFRGGWRNLTPMRGRGRGGANPWTPAMLPPYAWYDAELGQPKNVGYVELSGVSGDYISTPDSAALSFSNDIEVVMRVRVTDWSTGSGQTLCGKYVSTGNQRSWRFYVSSTGSIGLSVSQDGTSSVTTVTVTPTVALADDAWVWLRMRLDLSNGTNSVGTLETAADTGDNVEPASWTANGTNTGTTIATVFDSTAALEIGAFAAGTLERLAGRVGRCIVRSGFAGTVVADFNADDCYGDGYTHTDGYRWTLGIPKVYDRSGNNHPPAVFGAGSNQPTWLPWDGIPSVYLPGASGNYVSCPDAAALDITGDLDIAVWATLDSWASGGNQALAGKWLSTGNQLSYQLRVNSTGNVLMLISTTGLGGGAVVTWTSSVALNLSAGTQRWVRGTLDVNNGAGGSTAKFYTSTDGATWTQLGADVTGAVAAPFAGSAALELGSESAGTASLVAGRVHRAIVRSGIDGTTVADFDAGLCGQSGYTDAYSNVWTVNRATSGRKAVVQSPVANSARSLILHGTDDVITVPAAAVPPMLAASNFEVNVVGRQWATTVVNGRWFDCRAASPFPGAVLSMSTGTLFSATLTDGTNSAGPTSVNLTYGQRAIATMYATDAGQTFGIAHNAETPSTASAAAVGARTGSDGTIARTAPAASGYQDLEFEALVTRSNAGTVADRAQLVSYYRGGL